MLHIPRPGRMKDPVNIGQILEIKREFPNVRLIVAHIGRAYTKDDLGDAFEQLKEAPDLMSCVKSKKMGQSHSKRTKTGFLSSRRKQDLFKRR